MNGLPVTVIKLGGGVLKNSENIKKIPIYLKKEKAHVICVVSALGHTTSLLEDIVKAYYNNSSKNKEKLFNKLADFHNSIIKELGKGNKKLADTLSSKVDSLLWNLSVELSKREEPFDKYYDKCVAYGEILSLAIISTYLEHQKFNVVSIDPRDFMITTSTHMYARPYYFITQRNIQNLLQPHLEKSEQQVVVTAGFVGSTPLGETTTMGKESSDLTAGFIACSIKKTYKVIFYKNTPGIVSADPEHFSNFVPLKEIDLPTTLLASSLGKKFIHPEALLYFHMTPKISNPKIIVREFGPENPCETEIKLSKNFFNNKKNTITTVLKNQIVLYMVPKFQTSTPSAVMYGTGIFEKYNVYPSIYLNLGSLTICAFSKSEIQINELLSKITEAYMVKKFENCQIYSFFNQEFPKIKNFLGSKKTLLALTNDLISTVIVQE